MTPDLNGPDFSTKIVAHAYAHFRGPHNPESSKRLVEFLRTHKWTGSLMLHFSQGGITDAIFEEVKRASPDTT